MYVFFDTETTGLPADYDAPASDTDNWPRIVQIAWALTDESGNELRSQSFIVQPVGFEIPASAASIHGITTEVARRLGIEIEAALEAFAKDIAVAETLVAHNVTYDAPIVSAEFFRVGRETPLSEKVLHCTMRSSADICKIPGQHGYKWPSLEELHNFLFGEGFASAHHAMADVRACAKCFFELKRRKALRVEIEDNFNPDVDDFDDWQSAEDRELFEEIYYLASSCSWFNLAFVNSVHNYFRSHGSISNAQRNGLFNIRRMLEEKVG